MDLRIGRIDPRAAALLAPILACDGKCDLSVNEQALVTALKGWDKQHYNDAINIEAAAGTEGSLDTAPATIFGAVAQAMVDQLFVRGLKDPNPADQDAVDAHPANDPPDLIPADYVARHERRGNHPYDAGTFHKLTAKILNPAKSTIPVQYDWLNGNTPEQFIKASLATALNSLQSEYGSTNPQDFRRVHARSSVCSLVDPLVGPCTDMPHQDRGSWLKIVGFLPDAR